MIRCTTNRELQEISVVEFADADNLGSQSAFCEIAEEGFSHRNAG